MTKWKWIFYSTVLMMFSDRLFVTIGGINVFAAYLIVVINFGLLLWMGSTWVPRGLLLFLGCLLFSGATGLLFDTVSAVAFTKDFVGILPNVVYACAFVRFLRFDVEGFFRRYADFAFYIALFGIIIFPLNLNHLNRLTSIMREPSGFTATCMPAVFYYADQWQRNGRYRLRLCIMLFAVALTFSSVGFMGLLLGLYLFGTRFRFGALVAPLFVVLAGLGIYNSSEFFRLRMDDTLRGLTEVNVYDTNLSSYGVLVSIFVTREVVQEHPIVGGGLGSYVIAHDTYAPRMPGNDFFISMGMGDLARYDASSLFLRILAEFGIAGLLLFFWCLLRFFPWGSTPERRAIAFGILCYVFMKCVRSGTYFDPDEWLFFLVYGVNGTMARAERKMRKLRYQRLLGLLPQPAATPSA